MTTKVHAIFENGVFRPDTPVPLVEGSKVELIVESEPDPRKLADSLLEIAHLPPEGPDDNFSGADHDRILYPEPDSR
jgi:predicted DNA-binding antitoxin AbrB/MazE fold protein